MAIFFNIAKDMPLHVVDRAGGAKLGHLADLVAYCTLWAPLELVYQLGSATHGGAVCEACIHELVLRDKERKGSLWPYYSSTTTTV